MHMQKRKILRFLGIVLLVVFGVLVILAVTGSMAYAAGLVDNTVNDDNLYSKYPLDNYQLDFYVDTSWDWLPWNWLSGIGKDIQYGLYAITNFVWTVSLYISNATGYVVQEAYKLDFISDTANAIGENIQTLAGVTRNGFSSEGFYVGFLLILIFIMGIYVAYTGLIKRETTKAVHAVVNFLVVFILSASFIAYAPDYISKINDFSADVSNAALSLGTKIVLPDSDSKGRDSVDLIRDSLFSIQVKQPWLLLQYGESDIEVLGADRVEELLSANPDTEDREQVVIDEIENKDNLNMSITKTISRLGTVVFLFFFNIGISIFVFLLTGMMIFSQVLFIIFAMFLPISFILAMMPTYEGMARKALTKLFNTIMMRAGLTLVITTAFSISTMFYSISSGYPFFMVAFLQIVTFAGIYMKLGELMGMFSLQSSDAQQVGRRIMRRPYAFLNRGARRLERKIGRTVAAGAAGGMAGASVASRNRRENRSGNGNYSKPNRNPRSSGTGSLGERAGAKMGAVLDTKDRMKDRMQSVKQQVKDMPTQSRYAIQNGRKQVRKNASDFKWGVAKERALRMQGRADRQEQYRQTTAGKRAELDQLKQDKATAAKAAGTNDKKYRRPIVDPASAKTTPQEKKFSGSDAVVKERPGSALKEMSRPVKDGRGQGQAKTQDSRPSVSDPENVRQAGKNQKQKRGIIRKERKR